MGKDVQYLEQMNLSRPSAGAAYSTPESRSATGHARGMVLTPPGPSALQSYMAEWQMSHKIFLEETQDEVVGKYKLWFP